jgi:citrate lyase beta subunit
MRITQTNASTRSIPAQMPAEMEAASSSDGVFVQDGQMVDAPVIGRAQAILMRAI